MCNGLLWLFGLKEEEGLKPRAARSRLARKVQCLGATNAFLDNLSLFFFEERNKNSHKLYKYLQKKEIKNFPETHNWLSRA